MDRHASVQQLQFCPSVADSWRGWHPVQAGSHKEYVHHNIMPEAVFEVIKPTFVSLKNKAIPGRGDAKPEWGFQCHDLVYVAQRGICWCWSGGAISTSGCFMKNGMHYRELYWILCAARRCLKSQEGWIQGWWKQKYRRKTLKRRRKGFEEKKVEADGQTYEPGAFWPQLLWVTRVF